MMNLKKTVSKYVDELTWTVDELKKFGNNENQVKLFKCQICDYIRYNMLKCEKCQKLICKNCFQENNSPVNCLNCDNKDNIVIELESYIKKILYSFNTICKFKECKKELNLEDMKCHIKNDCNRRKTSK